MTDVSVIATPAIVVEVDAVVGGSHLEECLHLRLGGVHDEAAQVDVVVGGSERRGDHADG